MQFVTLGKRSYIGGTIINNFSVEIKVGNYTSIADGLTIFGNGGQHPPVMHPQAVSTFPFNNLYHLDYFPTGGKGDIHIGSDVWIGGNVTLLDGIRIGDGVIVGAGAVVAKDIPPFAIAVGNPVKIIKYRFSEEIIEKLLTLKWWEWDDEKVFQSVPLMKDINGFLSAYAQPQFTS